MYDEFGRFCTSLQQHDKATDPMTLAFTLNVDSLSSECNFGTHEINGHCYLIRKNEHHGKDYPSLIKCGRSWCRSTHSDFSDTVYVSLEDMLNRQFPDMELNIKGLPVGIPIVYCNYGYCMKSGKYNSCFDVFRGAVPVFLLPNTVLEVVPAYVPFLESTKQKQITMIDILSSPYVAMHGGSIGTDMIYVMAHIPFNVTSNIKGQSSIHRTIYALDVMVLFFNNGARLNMIVIPLSKECIQKKDFSEFDRSNLSEHFDDCVHPTKNVINALLLSDRFPRGFIDNADVIASIKKCRIDAIVFACSVITVDVPVYSTAQIYDLLSQQQSKRVALALLTHKKVISDSPRKRVSSSISSSDFGDLSRSTSVCRDEDNTSPDSQKHVRLSPFPVSVDSLCISSPTEKESLDFNNIDFSKFQDFNSDDINTIDDGDIDREKWKELEQFMSFNSKEVTATLTLTEDDEKNPQWIYLKEHYNGCFEKRQLTEYVSVVRDLVFSRELSVNPVDILHKLAYTACWENSGFEWINTDMPYSPDITQANTFAGGVIGEFISGTTIDIILVWLEYSILHNYTLVVHFITTFWMFSCGFNNSVQEQIMSKLSGMIKPSNELAILCMLHALMPDGSPLTQTQLLNLGTIMNKCATTDTKSITIFIEIIDKFITNIRTANIRTRDAYMNETRTIPSLSYRSFVLMLKPIAAKIDKFAACLSPNETAALEWVRSLSK